MLDEIIMERIMIKSIRKRDWKGVGTLAAKLKKKLLLPTKSVKKELLTAYDQMFIAFRKEFMK